MRKSSALSDSGNTREPRHLRLRLPFLRVGYRLRLMNVTAFSLSPGEGPGRSFKSPEKEVFSKDRPKARKPKSCVVPGRLPQKVVVVNPILPFGRHLHKTRITMRFSARKNIFFRRSLKNFNLKFSIFQGEYPRCRKKLFFCIKNSEVSSKRKKTLPQAASTLYSLSS